MIHVIKSVFNLRSALRARYRQCSPKFKSMNAKKYEKKSPNHANEDANITCDSGEGDISR